MYRKLAEFAVGSNVVRAIVPTKAEEGRRAEEAQGRPLGPTYVPHNELPAWARGRVSMQYPSTPHLLPEAMMQARQTHRPVRFIRR
jgi:hypothetical protein